MDLETAQTTTTAKFLILKQGEYDMWRLKIEQYIQVQDYALWDIIENGNPLIPVAQTTTNADGTSTTLIPGPVTTEEKVQKKNDVKERSMLLMSLPNEHLMTFNQYKDAKTLFAAIQTRFGGNEATKKTQKTLLKQINIPDLDTMSFDDLYNNFKIVEQEVKGTANSSSSSSSQNMAFVSSPSSTNEVNTAYGVSTANLSDATVYAFLSSQLNESQLVHEDLVQIHEDDLEEIDLKWQLALLSIRTRKFFQKTGRKITINGSDTAGYDKSKVKCFNYHKLGHFAKECRQLRNQDSRNRNQDSSRRTINVEKTTANAMVAIDGAGFDWSYMADDEVPTNMALIAFLNSEGVKYLITVKKGVEFVSYNAVPPPPIWLFSPPKLDLSNSGLEEFQQPEFKGYRPKTSKSVSKDISNEANCNYHQRERVVSGNNYTRVNYNNSTRKTHPSAHRNMAPRVVLMKTGLRPLNTARPVNTAHPKTTVYSARPMTVGTPVNTVRQVNTANSKPIVNYSGPILNAFKRGHSQVIRPYNKYLAYKKTIFNKMVNTVRVKDTTDRERAVVSENIGREANDIKASACWVWKDKHSSASNTFKKYSYIDARGGSKSIMAWIPKRAYFSYYIRRETNAISLIMKIIMVDLFPLDMDKAEFLAKEFDGEYVTFGGGAKGWKITGKGTLKTGKLDFEDVYFVKELHFNLLSISQICDKKNNVLFTNTRCFILSPDFKLTGESQVLLKVPRKNNMCSVDMKNIVSKESLTCLVAKATLDESMLWHKRLGHVNFKTINKIVMENLVRGLPTKRFENDQTCVACLKGKQHKASYLLLVFFLGTKDETSGILKSFITEIENLVDKKNASYDEPQPFSDAGNKDDEGVSKESRIGDQERPSIYTASLNVNTDRASINIASPNVNTDGPSINTANTNNNVEVDLSNISTTYLVPSTPNTRIIYLIM
nr:hypothetical protein [Tanacetum cinerariifolium]